jgi:transcriptional regulator with XRE-family HTH domain
MQMQLKDLRKKNGLTQKELAGKLSVSKSYVSQLERGQRQMSLDMLRRFASVFLVKPEDVLRALEITQHEVPVEKDLAMQVSRIVKRVMKKKVVRNGFYGNSNTNR